MKIKTLPSPESIFIFFQSFGSVPRLAPRNFSTVQQDSRLPNATDLDLQVFTVRFPPFRANIAQFVVSRLTLCLKCTSVVGFVGVDFLDPLALLQHKVFVEVHPLAHIKGSLGLSESNTNDNQSYAFHHRGLIFTEYSNSIFIFLLSNYKDLSKFFHKTINIPLLKAFKPILKPYPLKYAWI